MGSSYSNVTLKGPGHEAVAAFLARSRRTAYVSIQDQGCIVVCDKEADRQDDAVIVKCAAALSQEFNCPALAVLIHDSDICMYWLFERGSLVDTYNSWPGYFKGGPREPQGGNAARLAGLMGDGAISIGLDTALRACPKSLYAAIS